MYKFEMESKSKKTGKKYVKAGILIFTALATLVTLVMTGVIHNTQLSRDKEGKPDIEDFEDPCGIRAKFPERFRTQSEQDTYVRYIGDRLGLTYHGCCSTKVNFNSPTTVACIENGTVTTNRTVASFGNSYQFIQFEICSITKNCAGTECNCGDALNTIVYVDNTTEHCGERYGICHFRYKGCCKCTETI